MWVVLVDFLKANAGRQIGPCEEIYDHSGVWNRVQLKHILEEKSKFEKWSYSLFFFFSIKSLHYRRRTPHSPFLALLLSEAALTPWNAPFSQSPLGRLERFNLCFIHIWLETGHCFQIIKECFHAIEISKYLYIMPAFSKGHIVQSDSREKYTE